MAINTSGLSGYAAAYARAINSGASDTGAHAAATQATGTAGSGSGTGFASFGANGQPMGYALDSSPSGFSSGYSLTGVVPQYGAGPTSITPVVDKTITPAIDKTITQQINPQDYINQLKDAQRQSRIAALDKAKTSALGSLDTEQANVAPTYYDKRNQAAASSDVGAMNFAQYMAARGIKGAAGAMPEIYRNAGLQGQIGALDQQEASNLAGIERQRSNINTGYASDVAGANADVEAQAMQSMIAQYNADRSNNLATAQLTGSLGNARTLAGQQYDYNTSPSNPANIQAIATAKKIELDNAYTEIVNSYASETEKLKAQQLKQKVDAGQYDTDTALAQLDQIRAQTAQAQRAANTSYSSGSSGSSSSSNDLKTYEWAQTQATAMAKADPRLADGVNTFADGANYFTMPQLIDAYMGQLAQSMYGG
jgi:hypothetical protein